MFGANTRTKKYVLWLYFFATIGFSLGTLTLLGPVRWIATLARAHDWRLSTENTVVTGVILLLIVVTAIVARLCAARILVQAGRRKVLTPLLTALIAALAVVAWMTPAFMIGHEERSEIVAHFTFGSYPSLEKMKELKDHRYTAVVSLLHPAVVPFEPALLEEEKKAAHEVGLELIHLPMLPWISSNDEAIEAIKKLARSAKGKYYVHCYLGRDRVNVVKRVVEKFAAETTVEGIMESRSLSEISYFERGDIIHLPDSVTLVPFPTKEEFLGFILSGKVKHVAVVHERGLLEDSTWLAETFQTLERYEMSFTDVAVSAREVAEAVRTVASLPKPCVVMFYSTRTPLAMEFRRAYEKK